METNSYIRVGTADSAKPKKKEVLCLILGTGRAHLRSTVLTLLNCDVMVRLWRHRYSPTSSITSLLSSFFRLASVYSAFLKTLNLFKDFFGCYSPYFQLQSWFFYSISIMASIYFWHFITKIHTCGKIICPPPQGVDIIMNT